MSEMRDALVAIIKLALSHKEREEGLWLFTEIHRYIVERIKKKPNLEFKFGDIVYHRSRGGRITFSNADETLFLFPSQLAIAIEADDNRIDDFCKKLSED